VRLVGLCVLAIACHDTQPPRCSDAGVDDVATANCCQLSVGITQLVDEDRGCDADSDCTETATACGLSYVCGGLGVNQRVPNDPTLTAMLGRWNAMCTGVESCRSCPRIPAGRQYLCQTSVCQVIDP
jgi:hypothetical protein